MSNTVNNSYTPHTWGTGTSITLPSGIGASNTNTNDTITINKANNGFIISQNNKKYVAKTMVDVVHLLSELTKKEEK